MATTSGSTFDSTVAVNIGDRFLGRNSGRPANFDMPATSGPDVPPDVRDYVLSLGGMKALEWLAQPDRRALWLYGPTGSGKSTLIRVMAARLNLPVFEANGSSAVELRDFLGRVDLRVTPEGGTTTVFTEGPLLRAYRTGGIFLLNEGDGLSPAALLELNTVLDRAPLFVPQTGETVACHNAFMFILTANTNGGGDVSGAYAGTNIQNRAFVNRFRVVQQGYLEPVHRPDGTVHDPEVGLLCGRVPGLTPEEADVLVRVAREIRAGFFPADGSSPTIGDTVTMRDLCDWAWLVNNRRALVQKGVNIMFTSFEDAVLSRMSEGDRAIANEAYQRVVGNN